MVHYSGPTVSRWLLWRCNWWRLAWMGGKTGGLWVDYLNNYSSRTKTTGASGLLSRQSPPSLPRSLQGYCGASWLAARAVHHSFPPLSLFLSWVWERGGGSVTAETGEKIDLMERELWLPLPLLSGWPPSLNISDQLPISYPVSPPHFPPIHTPVPHHPLAGPWPPRGGPAGLGQAGPARGTKTHRGHWHFPSRQRPRQPQRQSGPAEGSSRGCRCHIVVTRERSRFYHTTKNPDLIEIWNLSLSHTTFCSEEQKEKTLKC